MFRVTWDLRSWVKWIMKRVNELFATASENATVITSAAARFDEEIDTITEKNSRKR